MRNGGENGFGYDPIFYLPDMSRTTAELSPEEKNSISHRGRALQAVKEDLGGEDESMRVLVVSDTHGHLENLERALEETGAGRRSDALRRYRGAGRADPQNDRRPLLYGGGQ